MSTQAIEQMGVEALRESVMATAKERDEWKLAYTDLKRKYDSESTARRLAEQYKEQYKSESNAYLEVIDKLIDKLKD